MIAQHRYRMARYLSLLPLLLVTGLVCMVYEEIGVRYLLGFWILGPSSILQKLCSSIELLLFTCLVVLCLWSYLKTALTHPGHSPLFYRAAHPSPAGIGVRVGQRGRIRPVLGPDGTLHCRTCQAAKPPRCKHDSVSGECALKFDHFCPWVGNTVGYRNYKSFVLFVGYTALAGFFAAFCCRLELYLLSGLMTRQQYRDALGGKSWQPGLAGMLAVVMSVSFGCSLLCFVGCHLHLASNNQSTVESTGQRGSPYDLGAAGNLQQVFGADWKMWFLPVMTDDALVATRMGTYFRRSVASVVASGEAARFSAFRDRLRRARAERFLEARGFSVPSSGSGRAGGRSAGELSALPSAGSEAAEEVRLAGMGRLPLGAKEAEAEVLDGADSATGAGSGRLGPGEEGQQAAPTAGVGWGQQLRRIGDAVGVVTLGDRSAYAHGAPPTCAAGHSFAAAYAVAQALSDPTAAKFDLALFAGALFLTERLWMGGALQKEEDGGAFFEALEVEVARQLLREESNGRARRGDAGVGSRATAVAPSGGLPVGGAGANRLGAAREGERGEQAGLLAAMA